METTTASDYKFFVYGLNCGSATVSIHCSPYGDCSTRDNLEKKRQKLLWLSPRGSTHHWQDFPSVVNVASLSSLSQTQIVIKSKGCCLTQSRTKSSAHYIWTRATSAWTSDLKIAVILGWNLLPCNQQRYHEVTVSDQETAVRPHWKCMLQKSSPLASFRGSGRWIFFTFIHTVGVVASLCFQTLS